MWSQRGGKKVQENWGRAGVGYPPSLGELFKITLRWDAHPEPEPLFAGKGGSAPETGNSYRKRQVDENGRGNR